MIPRIIHRIWIGKRPDLSIFRQCDTSVRTVLPEYAIFDHTGESLEDIAPARVVEWARSVPKEHISVPCDIYRWWVILAFGGVYVDWDVEMIKPFDRSHHAFIGFQRADTNEDCLVAGVVGSEAGNSDVEEIVDRILKTDPASPPPFHDAQLITMIFREWGLFGLNVEQDVRSVHVYEKDVFYPWTWMDEPDSSKITEKTICVHHWTGSWKR